MLLETGEKVHVIVRRSFETDIRRHFIGEIKATDGPVVRIIGFLILFDKNKNMFVRKNKMIDSILDLSSNGYWVNMLPRDVDIAELKYEYDVERRLTLTDGKTFSLDINEFGLTRQ